MDTLLESFKHLSFDDLRSLTTTNKQISSAVWEEMRRRFMKKMVVFDGLMKEDEYSNLQEKDDKIIIDWDDGSILALEQFGDVIRNLQVWSRGPLDEQKVQTVFKVISERCSDSLDELHLGDFESNFFQNITKPFKNVHTLELYGNVIRVDNDQFNFHELFPSLRRLIIGAQFKAQNKNKLFVKLPQLEHLDVDSIESVARGVIEKNPQLKTLILQYAKSNILKFATDSLPNLEHLELNEYKGKSKEIENINVANVKVFKLNSLHNYKWPKKMIFSKVLEEFEVDVGFDSDTRYVDFIERYNSLKKLKISASWDGIDDESMKRIIAAKLNLNELSLHYGCNVNNKEIVELIQSNDELKKFHLRFINEPEKVPEFASVLREHFGAEFWTVSTADIDVFMTRK